MISRCVASRRGRRQRHARNAREALGEVAEREVVGAEVVAPLRHAVRFVDRDDAEPCRAAASDVVAGAREPLGRDVEQIELAREERLLDGGALGRRLRRVEVRGAHAVGDERVDLIVHERDERAHDEARAGAHERGHLVA